MRNLNVYVHQGSVELHGVVRTDRERALAVTIAVGEFRPAAVLIFIMAVVGALESYTLDKTRRAIRDLLRLAPPTATVRRGGVEVTVPAAELQVGDIVVVRPGERIPVDGVVTAGAGAVNWPRNSPTRSLFAPAASTHDEDFCWSTA